MALVRTWPEWQGSGSPCCQGGFRWLDTVPVSGGIDAGRSIGGVVPNRNEGRNRKATRAAFRARGLHLPAGSASRRGRKQRPDFDTDQESLSGGMGGAGGAGGAGGGEAGAFTGAVLGDRRAFGRRIERFELIYEYSSYFELRGC
jgi:hypothetical protein